MPAAQDPTLFSSRRDTATISPQISEASNPSMKHELPKVEEQQVIQPGYAGAIISGDKKSRSSRWPFRRKPPTEDEIKEKMKYTVGDAF